MIARADYNFVVKYGEVTPDGVAVFDLNSRKFVYLNRFLREILGMGDRETVEAGASILKFVHPEDMEYAENRYRELLSIGCMAPVEFRVVQADGKTKTVSVEVLWLEECYTFALFVKDVTTLREHDTFVVKISAQKDTLLDMLLHNLSGPLFLSRDLLALMQKSGDQNEAGRMVNIIAENTAHCIGIIQQFLQEEHTESTHVRVHRSRFSVLEKIRVVIDLIHSLNKEKNLVLDSKLEDTFITSDPVKCCQVIHNILSNAVKFTEDTGRISVNITGDSKAVQVTVTDDGTGVPEHLRDKLFVQRVVGTPGLKGEPSNGLGLYLCHQLAQLVNGHLSYSNLDSGGSVFSFLIPRE